MVLVRVRGAGHSVALLGIFFGFSQLDYSPRRRDGAVRSGLGRLVFLREQEHEWDRGRGVRSAIVDLPQPATKKRGWKGQVASESSRSLRFPSSLENEPSA